MTRQAPHEGMIHEEVGGLSVWRWPEVTTAPVPSQRHISVGAFFDRFGPLKWAILADQSPTVQAVVRDASVRKFIDLANPDLPAGLQILIAAGHAIDAAAIVEAPIQPEELP